MDFNEKFLEFFKQKDLTHGEIAHKLGVSRPTINRILNEGHPPSFKLLQNLADAYPDINLDYFIRDNYDAYDRREVSINLAEDNLSADLLSELRKMEIHIENMKQRLSQY